MLASAFGAGSAVALDFAVLLGRGRLLLRRRLLRSRSVRSCRGWRARATVKVFSSWSRARRSSRRSWVVALDQLDVLALMFAARAVDGIRSSIASFLPQLRIRRFGRELGAGSEVGELASGGGGGVLPGLHRLLVFSSCLSMAFASIIPFGTSRVLARRRLRVGWRAWFRVLGACRSMRMRTVAFALATPPS